MKTWFGLLSFTTMLAAGGGSAAAMTRPEMQMGTMCSPQGTSLSITARDLAGIALAGGGLAITGGVRRAGQRS